MKTIGFAGGGNMAEAILQGIIASGLYAADQVIVSDVRPERLRELHDRYQINTANSNAELARQSDIIVLAVKPYQLDAVLGDLRGTLKKQAVLVSIIAGKRVATMTSVLGDIPVVRVMPNTPALLNQGASALYATEQAKPALKQITDIFTCVGQAMVVESEELIDAVTAVSGSGPAYFYLLMESMIDTGVKLGLSLEAATTLVLQTAKGAALLAEKARENQETPAQLTRKVATPGGTTEAALNVFHEGGLPALVEKALTRARDRSRELSSNAG